MNHFVSLFASQFSILFCALLLSSAALVHGQITLDHDFSDWPGDEVVAAEGAPGATSMLVEAEVASDELRLFFRLKYEGLLGLDETSVPHGTTIAIDCDGDESTGVIVNSTGGAMGGADLIVQLFSRSATEYVNGIAYLLSLNDILLRPSPTYGDSEFELAIDLSEVNITGEGNGGTIRWTIYDSAGGQTIGLGGASHVLGSVQTAIVAKPLARDSAADVRVAFWNMNGRFDQSYARQAMERLLTATAPDVIGFSEVSDVSASYVAGYLEQWLPLVDEAGNPGTWHVEKDDYDLMVASRWPISQTFPAVYRQFPVVIDTEAIFGAPMLVTSSHLKCCDDPAGQRQEQADEYMSFLRDAMAVGGELTLPPGSPIIYGGDLNMVGLGSSIRTLLTGDIEDEENFGADFAPDWDGSTLTELAGVQTDHPMNYTWRNDNSEWAAGKLDYMIVHDAAITVLADFAMETSSMPADRLAQFGLQSGDDLQSSDHYLIVTDISINADVSDLPDDDGDGIPNVLDLCPTVSDPLQGDFNEDGIGDACQDSDGDGLSDFVELYLFSSDPSLFDSDGNGIDDASELLNDPSIVACLGDMNSDGLVSVTDLMIMLGAFGQICPD